MPKAKREIRYAALASIIPLASVIGKILKKSSKEGDSR